MDAYNLVLFIHILGALGLFIATGINQLILIRLRRVNTVEQVRDLLEMAGVASKLEAIAVLLLVGAGLYLAGTAWGYDEA